MLSLENIVRNPEDARSALVRRGEDPPIDQIWNWTHSEKV